MLHQCVRLLPTRVLSHRTVITNGKDIILLGNKETEAASKGVIERNTAYLGSQDSIHVIPVIEFIVEPLRHPNHIRQISILCCYQIVLLKKNDLCISKRNQVLHCRNLYVQIAL